MYLFNDEDLNRNQFFRFNKKLVLNMTWGFLPLNAQAVLPVLLAHANGKGQAWPSEETISALSGLSPKTVRKGINELLALPGFKFDWQMTATGRKSKKFTLPMPTSDNRFTENDKFFFFHKFILTGGNWRLLKPIAKAVYPVLRTFSVWDKGEAEEAGLIDNADGDYKDAYAQREWEYSELEPGMIGRYAGIERARVYGALRNLEERNLLERCGERRKVFFIPPQYYKRAFLNEQLMKSFAHRRESENG
ncbi:MAG: helix-turn-helix domain-containing protein [Pseudomonadota bacterium]